ncbi:MAG TPA: hypothetical protein VIS94_14685 [Desulfomonilia bacterium]
MITVFFPGSVFASGGVRYVSFESLIPEKSETVLIEDASDSPNSEIISGLKMSDNGVTRINGGQLMIKVSGYSDSAIMKYVNSMGCSLSRKLSPMRCSDDIESDQNLKTVNNGLYIKSAIKAINDSGIFILASGGVELNSSDGSIYNLADSPGMFAGGGIGYFLKNCSMQFGYDSKIGASASFGMLW